MAPGTRMAKKSITPRKKSPGLYAMTIFLPIVWTLPNNIYMVSVKHPMLLVVQRESVGLPRANVTIGGRQVDRNGNPLQTSRPAIINRKDALRIARGEITDFKKEIKDFGKLPPAQRQALIDNNDYLGTTPFGDLRRGITLKQQAIKDGKLGPNGQPIDFSPRQKGAIDDAKKQIEQGKPPLGPVTLRKFSILDNIKQGNKSQRIREFNK